jgi:integrase/recombinase XerD
MIFEETDKQGNVRVVCSKYWPDGSRFRRRYPNKTLAKVVQDRIAGAIATGNWRALKAQLTGGEKKEREDNYTVEQFSAVYLKEYCEIRNTRPDFKRETFKTINEIVGSVRLSKFTPADALRFETKRAEKVSAATINGGLAVLKNMFTFAVKKGILRQNPMERYQKIKVDEKTRRVLEAAEARLIVEKTLEVDPVVGAYLGVIAETGLRMEEGLHLRWQFVDVPRRRITVEAATAKSGKSRYVPMSEYAAQLLGGLTRIVGEPFVFIRESTGTRLRAPRKEFELGKKAAKITWPGFHDFRHYRATQWLRNGVDIRVVQQWLGHKDINTTMIYLHFVEDRAAQQFAEAQKRELLEIAGSGTDRRSVGDRKSAFV